MSELPLGETPQELRIEDIRIFPSVTPRAPVRGKGRHSSSAVDLKIVRQYRDSMRAGVEFPPIVVGEITDLEAALRTARGDSEARLVREAQDAGTSVLALVDGMHRVLARREFADTIMAKVVPVRDFYHARWLGLVANETHGLPLKRRERAQKLDLYVMAKMHIDETTGRCKSLRVMARELGISHMTVKRKLKESYAPIFELLRKRDGEDPPRQTPLEELVELRHAKRQRELLEGGATYAELALASVREIANPELAAAHIGRLEETARDLSGAVEELRSRVAAWRRTEQATEEARLQDEAHAEETALREVLESDEDLDDLAPYALPSGRQA